MHFSFALSHVSVILFGIGVFFSLLICAIYCPRLLAIRKYRQRCQAEPMPDHAPDVSVIVYAFDQPESLERNLPKILAQKYPGNFAVIVVNDGSSPEINMVAGKLKMTNPHLRITFTPSGGRNISRRKLALTLGIKAAKTDYVLLCDASTDVKSDLWLASMMRHFAAPGTEVVIGYGNPESESEKLSATQAFDSVADGATWLYPAIKGHPYRGCGYNMAYKKDLFFKHNGFAQSINLKNGDDDIFVYDIADGNTAVELSEHSIVGHDTRWPKTELREYRVAHAFTGRKLPKGSRRVMALCEWMMLGAFISILAGAGYGMNWFGWIIAFLLMAGLHLIVGICWAKTARALGASLDNAYQAMDLAMTRPFRNIMAGLRSHSSSNNHFTWQ